MEISLALSRVPLYDLIATHGKMSERIDETKRSGGMKMGTGEAGGRRGRGRGGGHSGRSRGLRPDKTEAG